MTFGMVSFWKGEWWVYWILVKYSIDYLKLRWKFKIFSLKFRRIEWIDVVFVTKVLTTNYREQSRWIRRNTLVHSARWTGTGKRFAIEPTREKRWLVSSVLIHVKISFINWLFPQIHRSVLIFATTRRCENHRNKPKLLLIHEVIRVRPKSGYGSMGITP